MTEEIKCRIEEIQAECSLCNGFGVENIRVKADGSGKKTGFVCRRCNGSGRELKKIPIFEKRREFPKGEVHEVYTDPKSTKAITYEEFLKQESFRNPVKSQLRHAL